MNFWLTTIGEPLPTDGPNVRLLRHGLLAEILLKQGHHVDWWTSAWDHQQKRWRVDQDVSIPVSPNYRIHLLRGTGYHKNVSLTRLNDHRAVADKYTTSIASQPLPDLILSSFPTVGLCNASISFGQRHQVPIVIDVRDMWPDIFFDVFPKPLRRLIQLGTLPMVHANTKVLRAANAIVSMSEACLKWGLDTAGRERTVNDVVYPLAYRRPIVSDTARKEALSALRAKGVDPEKTICWYIGTLGKRYDVATILDSARLLEASHGDKAQFVISGDGDQSDKLRQQVTGLKNVVFTGWVQKPEIATLMELADIGIVAINDPLPTLPNKLFEYFSAGLPVVSCVSGEAAQLIENGRCGLNYSMHDSGSLASALQRFIDDTDLRSRYGKNAFQLYEQNYSCEAVYEPMMDQLVQIANSCKTLRKPAAAA